MPEEPSAENAVVARLAPAPASRRPKAATSEERAPPRAEPASSGKGSQRAAAADHAALPVTEDRAAAR